MKQITIELTDGQYENPEAIQNGSIACKMILEAVKKGVSKRKKGADIITLDAQGLDEGIRCAMCTNSMANDRGCDGGCVVDTAMYERVLKVIKECTVLERENLHREKEQAYMQGYADASKIYRIGYGTDGQLYKYSISSGVDMKESKE